MDSRLYAKGQPLADPAAQVEDYAVATLDLAGGCVVRLACSWGLQAGRDALIAAEFFGTEGSGLGFRIQIEVGRFGLDIVWAAIVVASVLGVASYLLMGALERRFVPARRP